MDIYVKAELVPGAGVNDHAAAVARYPWRNARYPPRRITLDARRRAGSREPRDLEQALDLDTGIARNPASPDVDAAAQAAREPWLVRMSETRANTQAAFAADILAAVGLLVAGLTVFRVGPLAAMASVLSGLLLFSLVEYAFHRYLFHGGVPLFSPGHRKHHDNPTAQGALPFFLPPAILVLIAAVLGREATGGVSCLVAGGLALGYLCYGLAHDAIHARRFQQPLLRRWAGMHHVHHHHPDTNFGVTTPLWDVVFGTRYRRKPRD